MLACKIPWHTVARDLAKQGLGGCDPSFLFSWPLARVLVVFFDGMARGVLSEEQVLERVNRKRAEKGLPPTDRLPFQGKHNGR